MNNSDEKTIVNQAKNIYEFLKESDLTLACDDCVIKDSKFGLTEVFRNFIKEKEIEYRGGNISRGTFTRYKSTARNIERFLKEELRVSEISIKHVTREFILKFGLWLDKNPRIQSGTRSTYVRAFITFLRVQYDLGIIRTKPFSNIHFKQKEKIPLYLTDKEMKLFREYKSNDPVEEDVRDIFLFLYNTGLYYSDAITLTHDSVENHLGYSVVNGNRKKTQVEFLVPLSFEAKYLIEKFKTHADVISTGKIIPTYAEVYLNRKLKLIAYKLGINKLVSLRIARHSFATSAILYGVPITTLQKVLGHKDIKSTLIYTNVINHKVYTDMSLFNAGILDQMSNSTSEEFQHVDRRVTIDVEDQSWLAERLANDEVLASIEKFGTTKTYKRIIGKQTKVNFLESRSLEFLLLMNLPPKEYLIYSFLRLAYNHNILRRLDSTDELEFSAYQIQNIIGGAYEPIHSALKKLDEKGIVQCYSYYKAVGNCYLEFISEDVWKEELIIKTKGFREIVDQLDFIHAPMKKNDPEMELAQLKNWHPRQYRLYALLRVLNDNGEVHLLSNQIDEMLGYCKGNSRTVLKRLHEENLIEYVSDGSAYRIFIPE